MRMNILQHTPNEGPGTILDWAQSRDNEVFIYHPAQFQILPKASETDFLVILGGPMSPNDQLSWIQQERFLIQELLNQNKPIFGVCFGAQQISKTLGYAVVKAPIKEVGWGNVVLQSQAIPKLPTKLDVLHWHEETFVMPQQAKLLFSNQYLANQGFLLGHHVAGLQFHLEPKLLNVREMAINDQQYVQNSIFQQSVTEILEHPVPSVNRQAMFVLLDYLVTQD
ncbi:type 1 glutamine amidotransferase [Bombilactobacillus folatiphilus]|uniref:Type 1 glutamine amidotransferase n=1 Tax=Bombilactobacillus folatiphilus TaxID=2923362 RepID=A0ABY4PB37_9LACO|nr:type 1 glutamine amidotransferase [Bombilactobacillus folatiphilus]UQS82807.1 type 1 glutamine amidotransferase [Bombilactobacillus folatiphilus]